MSEITLTPAELEEIKDDASFKTRVILELKGLNRRHDSLPCKDHDFSMSKIEKVIEGIKTQVYFQWAVLGVILFVIVKTGLD